MFARSAIYGDVKCRKIYITETTSSTRGKSPSGEDTCVKDVVSDTIITNPNKIVNYIIYIPGINNLVPGAGVSPSERLLKPVTASRGTA